MCNAEAGSLRSYMKTHPDFAFMGVHLTDGDDAGREFLARHDLDLPTLSDNEWKQAGKWGIQGHPATVLLDEHGRIVGGFYGGGGEDAWAELAAKLS